MYRYFAYRPNETEPLDGTEQIGNIAVSVDLSKPYKDYYGGVKWISGTEEDDKYVIASYPAYPFRFCKSDDDDYLFRDLILRRFRVYLEIDDIVSWLETNNHWSNYIGFKYPLISAGSYFSLSVLPLQNQTWGWGYNAYSQLGDYYNSGSYALTPISIHGIKKTFCHISAGYEHSMAIDNRGKVWGWGYNAWGELGVSNSPEDSATPLSIWGIEKTFCRISTGNMITTSINNHGQVWTWGYNFQGQLGDNTTLPRRTPVSIYKSYGTCKTFCHISTGYDHVAAIDHHGQVWTWGYNQYGKLGDNTTTERHTPVAICGNKTFCRINAAGFNTRALDYQGKVWSWGHNYNGQLGDNTITSHRTPVAVCGNKTFCHISGGSNNTFAIDYKGQVWSWGNNSWGRLGNNSLDNTCVPVSIHGNKKTFCRIESKRYHTLAVDMYGQIWGWGYSQYGELGYFEDSGQYSELTPVMIHTHKYPKITAGYSSSYALIGYDRYHGQVWGWGYNLHGELGDDSQIYRNTPVSILGTSKTFRHISAGYFHVIALDHLGKAWGWGYNGYGQLGDNMNIDRWTPVAVYGNKIYYHISAGYTHTVALDNQGKAWGWGYNSDGQLGDNTTLSKRTPVSVYGDKTFCHISAGGYYTSAIDYLGKVWAWGNNFFGQLGDNTETPRNIPVSVYGIKRKICQIECGEYFTICLDIKGQVWGWGYNGGGELGDNTWENKCIPVSIHGVKKTFCHIAVGILHSIAIDYKGQVWGWGYNQQGQLGDNTNLNSRKTPVSVHGGKKTFCRIASSGNHTLAVDMYDHIWAWGSNDKGQLGDNTTIQRLTPVRVCSF